MSIARLKLATAKFDVIQAAQAMVVLEQTSFKAAYKTLYWKKVVRSFLIRENCSKIAELKYIFYLSCVFSTHLLLFGNIINFLKTEDNQNRTYFTTL